MKEKEIVKTIEKLLDVKGMHYEHQVLGGMMNISHVLSNNGKQYIAYFPSDSGKEMVIRSLENENYKIAYDLGIAPKNYYFDEATGIKINEYILGSSLDKIEIGHDDIVEVTKILKKLHSSKKLSRSDYPVFSSLVGYEETLFNYSSTVDPNYLILKNLLFEHKEFLLKQKKCICHNDAQRSNFVKGLDGKYYLIDYEFAMNNDPIYDIAAFGNNSLKDGIELLKEYFIEPNEEQYKRFYLWRIYLSLQWSVVAMIKHYKDGASLGYDFTKVSEFFLNLGLEAKKGLEEFIK